MTYAVKPSNYAYGTLNAPITTGSTSITFTSSTGTSFPVLSKTTAHPQQYIYLTLCDAATQGVTTREIVKVIGPSSATTGIITYNIVRAQEGTSAHAFAAGDGVQWRWTAQTALDVGAQGAPASWFNVRDFGAVGDGATDDTVAFQDAIDAAVGNKGGVVHVPPGYNYYFTGVLELKDNVSLDSTITGSTGAWAAAGGTTVRAATLSVTNLSTTFINITGRNCAVRGFIFWYPNQLLPTAVTPTAYPYTITSPTGDTTLDSLTFVNCTHGISLQNGPQYLTNLRIGAFNVGILCDKGGAIQYMDNIQIGAGLLDAWLGYSFPQNLDVYMANNLVAIDVRRSDGFHFSAIVIFFAHIGIQFIDSVTISPTSSYGHINGLDLEGCYIGVVCQTTNSYLAAGGIKIVNFNNLGVPLPGPFTQSVNAIWMKAGGNTLPFLQIMNGTITNTYSGNIIQYDAGTLIIKQIYNGDYPSGNVTAPAVPATTVNATNPYPYQVTIYLIGGTYTDIKINGTLIGAAPSTVVLPANGTIAVTYTVAPTWKWYT